MNTRHRRAGFFTGPRGSLGFPNPPRGRERLSTILILLERTLHTVSHEDVLWCKEEIERIFASFLTQRKDF